MKYLFTPLLLIALNSCTKNAVTAVSVSDETHLKQTKIQLVGDLKQKGVFDSMQASSINSLYEVVTSKQGEKYFIKGGLVVSSSRNPKESESTLLYWRYRFQGKGYREIDVQSDKPDPHVHLLKQVFCDALGMGVIFNPETERVTRVFYYETP